MVKKITIDVDLELLKNQSGELQYIHTEFNEFLADSSEKALLGVISLIDTILTNNNGVK